MIECVDNTISVNVVGWAIYLVGYLVSIALQIAILDDSIMDDLMGLMILGALNLLGAPIFGLRSCMCCPGHGNR